MFSIFVFDILFQVVTFWVNFLDVGDATDINSWLVVSAECHEYWGRKAVLLSNCASRHVTLYRFHQIQVNFTIFWPLIELLIGDYTIKEGAIEMRDN